MMLCPWSARLFWSASKVGRSGFGRSAGAGGFISSPTKHLWTSQSGKSNMCISEEVEDALHSGKGVVALESTIITHGMPYPHNFSTALSVERKIRESGSVPATIAVLDGRLRIGLSDTELILLAEKSSSLVKISRRDISYVLSRGLSGGTTVSATMLAAHLAGIPVFATGGIGGVHRGVDTSFDISADLTELGRTPVAVISSGVKSILDIGKTLEYLETLGVFVGTFGDSKNFPAFFTLDSGHVIPFNVPSALTAAQIIDRQLHLGLDSGMLFAVPIPEKFSLDRQEMDQVIEHALELASSAGVTGKAVTPFILEEVNKLTAGSSLHANIALIENNAIVAGGIARCLSLMRQGVSEEDIMADSYVASVTKRTSSLVQPSTTAASPSVSLSSSSSSSDDEENIVARRPVVIGAAVIDFLVQVQDKKFEMNGATYPGKVFQAFGGVGRNVADCLSRLGSNPAFVSVVGDDSHANNLFAQCRHMDLSAVHRLTGECTATYCPVQAPSGQLLLGVGDMDINGQFIPDQISELDSILLEASMVVLDGNFSHAAIQQIVYKCRALRLPVWYEPTDIHKADKPFMDDSDAWQHLTLTSPNLEELKVMHDALMIKLGHTKNEACKLNKNVSCATSDLSTIITSVTSLCHDLVDFIPIVLVTLGPHGALLCHVCGDVTHWTPELLRQLQTNDQDRKSLFRSWYYPALGEGMKESSIASVSGAGDCLTAGFVSGIHQGKSVDSCVKMGFLAASFSLQSRRAVPDSIDSQTVTEDKALAWGTMERLDVLAGFKS